jgi:hypothetical protein
MLNDPVYMEASTALADRVLRESTGATDARIRHAFRLCLGREPIGDEAAKIRAFHDRQLERATKGEIRPGDAKDKPTPASAERAAWVAVARVLLNLDETITKE